MRGRISNQSILPQSGLCTAQYLHKITRPGGGQAMSTEKPYLRSWCPAGRASCLTGCRTLCCAVCARASCRAPHSSSRHNTKLSPAVAGRAAAHNATGAQCAATCAPVRSPVSQSRLQPAAAFHSQGDAVGSYCGQMCEPGAAGIPDKLLATSTRFVSLTFVCF